MQTAAYLESDYSRSYAIWLISMADLKASALPKKIGLRLRSYDNYRAYSFQVLFHL